MAEPLRANFNIVLSNKADAEFETFIGQQIKEFNNVHSEHHRKVRQGGITPLNIVIRDDDGQIVGGLEASTYWQWLDLGNLWLHENLRRQGLGQKLLKMAEEEALRRGCVRVHLSTFSFQARGFYEKYGYHVVGTLEDYPPGGAMYWMRKEL